MCTADIVQIGTWPGARRGECKSVWATKEEESEQWKWRLYMYNYRKIPKPGKLL
jgi:hypothetical protein